MDVFDQTERNYTTHTASRRWPLAIWKNLLDIEALYLYILYSKYSGSNIIRGKFIIQLIMCLRNANVVKRMQMVQREMGPLRKGDLKSEENVGYKVAKTTQLNFQPLWQSNLRSVW